MLCVMWFRSVNFGIFKRIYGLEKLYVFDVKIIEFFVCVLVVRCWYIFGLFLIMVGKMLGCKNWFKYVWGSYKIRIVGDVFWFKGWVKC